MNKTNQSIGNYRWTICGLLFFATTVNYLDRQVLSLLAPKLSEEFGWSDSDYANITAVFQFIYAISMLFAGRIIDKLGTKKGYILAITVWSLGAIMHAYSLPVGTAFSTFMVWLGVGAVPISIAGFMLSRAVLGFGESGNFPAAIKAVAEYFPKKERSFATGIFNSGSNVGAILAPLTVPVIAVTYGWEFAFILVGAIGFLWVIFWFIFYEIPSKQKKLSKAEYDYIHDDEVIVAESTEKPKEEKVAWFKLLGYKQTWAFVFGKFMTDGIWWFFLFWLPKYLKAQFNMEGTDVVLPLAVLYSMTMVGSIGGGWFPMYFINKGHNAYEGRMKAMLVIALFPLVVLLAQPLGHFTFWIPVLLIGVGASAHQAWSANIFTTVSDMFPKKAIGSIIGIGGMAGGLGGVLVSKLGGWLFDLYKTAGISESWLAAKKVGLGDYLSKIQHLKLVNKYGDIININKTDLVGLSSDVSAKLRAIDANSFDLLVNIQKPFVHDQMSISYTIMFVLCAVAYLIAWSVMKLLVPKYSPITDL